MPNMPDRMQRMSERQSEAICKWELFVNISHAQAELGALCLMNHTASKLASPIAVNCLRLLAMQRNASQLCRKA